MLNPHRFCSCFVVTLSMLFSTWSSTVFSADIEIISPWIQELPPTTRVLAAYMTIRNNTAYDDKLLSMETSIANNVEVHQSYIENGMAKMKAIYPVIIPANGEFVLKPGSYHIMLRDLTQVAPRDKEVVEVTFNFEKAGSMATTIMVLKRAKDKT